MRRRMNLCFLSLPNSIWELITHLAFHPQGDWLLGAGGDMKGVFLFIDAATGKIIREEPAATHFHKFVLDVDASGTRTHRGKPIGVRGVRRESGEHC